MQRCPLACWAGQAPGTGHQPEGGQRSGETCWLDACPRYARNEWHLWTQNKLDLSSLISGSTCVQSLLCDLWLASVEANCRSCMPGSSIGFNVSILASRENRTDLVAGQITTHPAEWWHPPQPWLSHGAAVRLPRSCRVRPCLWIHITKHGRSVARSTIQLDKNLVTSAYLNTVTL